VVLKKMAIFVEGQTEQFFLERLIKEIGDRNQITFKCTTAKQLITIQSSTKTVATKFFILIVNCENDEQVKSKIIENQENLSRSNYDLVIGLRDIYPLGRNKIAQIELALRTGIKTKGVRTEICLAKMEVEAWFLQETSHYIKIDPSLTEENISNASTFNPWKGNAEDSHHPAAALNEIYQLAGMAYKKDKKRVARTIEALDYENLYINLRTSLPYLNKLLTLIDDFFVINTKSA